MFKNREADSCFVSHRLHFEGLTFASRLCFSFHEWAINDFAAAAASALQFTIAFCFLANEKSFEGSQSSKTWNTFFLLISERKKSVYSYVYLITAFKKSLIVHLNMIWLILTVKSKEHIQILVLGNIFYLKIFKCKLYNKLGGEM